MYRSQPPYRRNWVHSRFLSSVCQAKWYFRSERLFFKLSQGRGWFVMKMNSFDATWFSFIFGQVFAIMIKHLAQPNIDLKCYLKEGLWKENVFRKRAIWDMWKKYEHIELGNNHSFLKPICIVVVHFENWESIDT